MDSQANMIHELVWLLREILEQSEGLNLHQPRKFGYVVGCPYDLAKVPTDFAKRVPIWQQHQGLVPPHQRTAHRQYGAIRVNRTSLVEQVDRMFQRIDHYHSLSEQVQGYEVACAIC